MSTTYGKRKSTSEGQAPSKRVKSETSSHPERQKSQNGESNTNGKDGVLNGTSSKEAHHKQKALKQERLAAKPNADSIARSKKIWERLRTKSKVEKEDRKLLVEELFTIITGRVKEFVFKHDAVRVIQCALKYATPDQKKQIVDELKGSYRELAESKYAKFLVAKLIVLDVKVRDVVVPEFYGHVKRMIRHPEASWIMDDIYRSMASTEQKARLLREWYGGEFAVLGMQAKDEEVTSDLSQILKQSPGKRGPVMQHLKELTNQLVQKKTTGFTMLHDALLQYFLNCAPGTPEHTELLELLRDDEEGDLFKNLAFTKSGSRLVCLALAYGTPKDRRNIMKHYKTHIKLMASDHCAHMVLLAAYEVIDDTVMTAKAIFPELTCKDLDAEARQQELLTMVSQINARIPLLYLMADEPPKWLLDTPHHETLAEIRQIRKDTSKKDPPTRRSELNKSLSEPLLAFVASQAEALLQTSFGCQFIGEVMLGASADKEEAADALSSLAVEERMTDILVTPHVGRLYKSLVQGGRYHPSTKTVVPSESPSNLENKLYKSLDGQDGQLLSWATGPNSWCLVAMLENDHFEHADSLLAYLKEHKAQMEAPSKEAHTNAGTKILLEKIGSTSATTSKVEKKSKKSKIVDAEPVVEAQSGASVKAERKKKKPKLIEVEEVKSSEVKSKKSKKASV